MNEPEGRPYVRIRRPYLHMTLDQAPSILSLFNVRLVNQPTRDPADRNFVYVPLEVDQMSTEQLGDLSSKIQNYVDSVVGAADSDPMLAGEDSSYDSDGDDERFHEDVSRTTSDTLGAEFAEYVNTSPQYAAKVEFALKLGYTEKQVQASLAKLGPNPEQNELLEELIKLGAQSPPLADEPEPHETARDGWALRPIIIDGSNVAMSHGNKTVFSCRGIKIAVDWFRSRGHRNITVFVPKWRKEAPRPDNPITEQEILSELERERILVYTPARAIGGKRTVCYDDRYVLRLAIETDGIVVSNDSYRDLVLENVEFKRVVEERTLMYSFVNDRFMPPDDPLGRTGPTLDNFLRVASKGEPLAPLCPYGKKCTYGNKCKYHHPERGPQHKSVTDRLVENARRHGGGVVRGKSLSVPLAVEHGAVRKQPLTRTRSGVPSAAQPFEDKVGKSWSVENVRCMPHQQPVGDSSANLHRKLQRQLTLNPNCDPRLYEMPGYMHLYDPGQHSGVTRMPSAPDPSRSCVTTVAPRMASDPTLYRPPTTEEVRRKLHFHLASIFPEEHVLAAMRSLPDETRPQEICAAILAMYPNS